MFSSRKRKNLSSSSSRLIRDIACRALTFCVVDSTQTKNKLPSVYPTPCNPVSHFAILNIESSRVIWCLCVCYFFSDLSAYYSLPSFYLLQIKKTKSKSNDTANWLPSQQQTENSLAKNKVKHTEKIRWHTGIVSNLFHSKHTLLKLEKINSEFCKFTQIQDWD